MFPECARFTFLSTTIFTFAKIVPRKPMQLLCHSLLRRDFRFKRKSLGCTPRVRVRGPTEGPLASR
jgi:hypothetical protein